MYRVALFGAVANTLAASSTSVLTGQNLFVLLMLVVAVAAFAGMSMLASVLAKVWAVVMFLVLILMRLAVVGVLALVVVGALLYFGTVGSTGPGQDAPHSEEVTPPP